MSHLGIRVYGKRAALIATVSAATLLAACERQFDVDFRGEMGALDTSLAAGLAAAPRPEPDTRGVISYPNFQVVVSQRGDTVSEVASRVGIGADALANYNGLKSTDILRSGEVLALPSRVSEPSPATGAFGTGPIRPISEIDITELAGNAIDRETIAPDTNAAQLADTSGLNVLPQTGLEPIKHKGMDVIPMEFLKDLQPVPSTLAEGYTGKTSIGVILRGSKDGQPVTKMIYNVCDHAETNKEVSAQAVSYTTGVPPVSGAAMFFKGEWSGPGVFNVEQFPAKPFLEDVAKRGLPWHVIDVPASKQDDLFAVET